MCGIFVVANPKKEDQSKFEHSLALQKHRGPDAISVSWIGTSLFGFVRLSIIDLSKKSMQPIKFGNISLVVNGEIYNYIEIRKQLISEGVTFKTEGDAEVLAAAINQWGPKQAFRIARGMWACVGYDNLNDKLIVSRDRFGIKPLWWSASKRGIIFSSEIKSILEFDESLGEVDCDVIYDYLADGVLDEKNRSFYKKIFSFPVSHYTVYKPSENSFQVKSYWSLPYKEHLSEASSDISRIRSKIENTVDLHLRSDVPIGLTLSAGLDSTILCKYAKERTNLSCYSLLHSVADKETQGINQTVSSWDLNHEYVPSEDVENTESIDNLLRILDQPFRATQTLYQYAIRERAYRDGVKVLITGDGADEVFGGYVDCIPFALSLLIRNAMHVRALETANGMVGFTGKSTDELMTLAEQIIQKNLNGEEVIRRVPNLMLDGRCIRKRLFSSVAQGSAVSISSVASLKDYLACRLMKTPMPYWLRVEDGTSMAFSIETRVPFLDHVLVEESFSWPENEFLNGNVNKSLLRRATFDIIPPHISNQIKKYQRPGSTEQLVFEKMNKEILLTLGQKDPHNILNTEYCTELFVQDSKNDVRERADFWFRLFLYIRWCSVSGIL